MTSRLKSVSREIAKRDPIWTDVWAATHRGSIYLSVKSEILDPVGDRMITRFIQATVNRS